MQYLLMSYNLKPFWSAVDRLVKGFCEDALTLLRDLYETFIRVVFISWDELELQLLAASDGPSAVRC